MSSGQAADDNDDDNWGAHKQEKLGFTFSPERNSMGARACIKEHAKRELRPRENMIGEP